MRRTPLSPLRLLPFVWFSAILAVSPSRAGQAPSPLAEQINRAIESGRDALLPRLTLLVENPRGDYPVGRMAFVLTALLKAGLPLEAPVVARAFGKLAAMKPTKTYCVSSYLFALNALIERRAEVREPIAGGNPAGPPSRTLGGGVWPPSEAAVRARMRRLVSWLVSARTRRRGSWTYGVGADTRRHDFSNTQFAVLGLEVGLEHGIGVPAEVFADIIRLFSECIQLEDSTVVSTYRLAASLEATLGLEPRQKQRRTRVQPGGWAYRSVSGRGAAKPAYAAMTAAGASSLIIALKALRQAPAGKWQRVIRAGEKTLHQSYAWIEKHFDDFIADGRQLCYRLYTLEKAGDLGEIAHFGERDWYVEGCRRLVKEQRASGSWGSYTDTALALLFLTRATRSLDVAAAPMLVTQGRGSAPPGANRMDLVYVDSAQGFLSARGLLRYMAATRNPKLVVVGKEIVRNYDPRHKEDLIPLLLKLWQKSGRLTAFARRAVTGIAGESFRTKLDCRRWYRAYLEIKSLDERPALDAAQVAAMLRTLRSAGLKAELVRLAYRRNLRPLIGTFVDELARSSGGRSSGQRSRLASAYCRELHGVLSLWTGNEVAAPAGDDRRGWAKTAKAWQRWCRENGGECVAPEGR